MKNISNDILKSIDDYNVNNFTYAFKQMNDDEKIYIFDMLQDKFNSLDNYAEKMLIVNFVVIAGSLIPDMYFKNNKNRGEIYEV